MGKVSLAPNMRIRTRLAVLPAGGVGDIIATYVDGGASGDRTFDMESALLALSPLVLLKTNTPSGTTCSDLSGNGRNGTIAGTYTLADWTGPDGEDYMSFTDARITIPDASVFDLTPSYGLTIFTVARRTGGGAYLVNKGTATPNYEFAVNFAQTVAVYGVGGSTRATTSTTDTYLGDNKPQVAATYFPNNNVLTPIQIRYNRNATSQNTVTNSASDPFDTTPTGDIWIGDRADGAGGHFVGQIPYVAIFANSVDMEDVFKAARGDGWLPDPETSYADGGSSSTTADSYLDGGDYREVTGGTITEPGDGYVYHTFTSSGSLVVPSGISKSVEYLVLGAGGGGKAGVNVTRWGTGGAGGVARTGSTTLSGTTTVTVGAGGQGGQTEGASGANGGSSSLGAVATATGGNGATSNTNGASNADFAGGTGVAPHSGGGAGAGEAGHPSTGDGGGGAGIEWPTGSGQYYGGGGGGRDSSPDQPGPAGLGGGGVLPTGHGTDGRGGGGGGGAASTVPTARGGDGGDGVVIVRYLKGPHY